MKSLFFILSLMLLFSCASCKEGVTVDTAMAAVEGDDYTALIEGCGNQLVPGYTYCRMMEGGSTNQKLFFVAPDVTCEGKKSEPCVTYQIFGPAGQVILSGAIERGQTRSPAVLWKTLVNRDTFQVEDRGFWGVLYNIRFLDKKGRERQVVTQGEIRMRVLRSGYVPLHNSPESKDFVWRFKDGEVQIKMTTGGRTWVSTKPAPKAAEIEDLEATEASQE